MECTFLYNVGVHSKDFCLLRGIMSKPKVQHIIPRCYLKQFVDKNTPNGQEPYVWIFERDSKKGKNKAPKNILTETDFYTLTTRLGEKDYTVEQSLARIENDYAAIFEEKITNKIPLNDYEHLIFCAFVAAMLQRTFKQKENMDGFYDQVINMTQEMERAHGIPPNKSVALKQEKESAHKRSVIKMVPYITKILLEMNLAFFCSSKPDSFITSDSPCFIFNSQLQWQHFDCPGLMQRHVEVMMPLSPKISACFSWMNNIRGYLQLNTDRVHELNRMVYMHSHRCFIANSPKLERRWFRRFPLDPIFIWRILINELKIKLARLRYRYHA